MTRTSPLDRSSKGPTIHSTHREPTMLTTVALVLLVLWALGLLGGFHAGGLIHLLLVIALVVVILRVVSGRRAL